MGTVVLFTLYVSDIGSVQYVPEYLRLPTAVQIKALSLHSFACCPEKSKQLLTPTSWVVLSYVHRRSKMSCLFALTLLLLLFVVVVVAAAAAVAAVVAVFLVVIVVLYSPM